MTATYPEQLEHLLLERANGVAVLTVNRPKVLNALNTPTLEELRRTTLAIKADDDVRAIILTGGGEKSFIAGADINELAVQSPTGGREHAMRGQHVIDLIEHLGKPVIAAINGYALGGGCEVAMACTLRLAADTANRPARDQSRHHPGICRNTAPDSARRAGPRAGDAADRGSISAQEAHRLGLVNRVVPMADLMTEARKLAAALAAKAPIAVRYIIDAVNRGCRCRLPRRRCTRRRSSV